ncbi:MAG: TRAP transporter small permease [Treponema sp.]|nr:TRAP transporter small permease [Treponema sp.]
MEKKKYHAEEIIGAVLLAGMAVLTFLNVINRYVFRKSIAFTEEITVNLFVWITLIGIAMAFRKGANLKMTNLFDRFGPKLQKTATTVAGVIGILIFGFVIVNSCQEIWKNMTFYRTTSEALGIPTWIYSLGTPVFSGMVIWQIARSTFGKPKAGKSGGGE